MYCINSVNAYNIDTNIKDQKYNHQNIKSDYP